MKSIKFINLDFLYLSEFDFYLYKWENLSATYIYIYNIVCNFIYIYILRELRLLERKHLTKPFNTHQKLQIHGRY